MNLRFWIIPKRRRSGLHLTIRKRERALGVRVRAWRHTRRRAAILRRRKGRG